MTGNVYICIHCSRPFVFDENTKCSPGTSVPFCPNCGGLSSYESPPKPVKVPEVRDMATCFICQQPVNFDVDIRMAGLFSSVNLSKVVAWYHKRCPGALLKTCSCSLCDPNGEFISTLVKSMNEPGQTEKKDG